jgi:phosphoglycerate kinase
LFDQPGSELVAGLVQKAKDKNVKLVFPVDYVTADSFSNNAKTDYATDQDGIPDGWMGLDCGKESNKIFTDEILSAKTILWNGPTGVFEFEKFAEGTKEALKAVIEATKNGATSIIGGGGKSLIGSGTREKED